MFSWRLERRQMKELTMLVNMLKDSLIKLTMPQDNGLTIINQTRIIRLQMHDLYI
jgi:hypothetical protein